MDNETWVRTINISKDIDIDVDINVDMDMDMYKAIDINTYI